MSGATRRRLLLVSPVGLDGQGGIDRLLVYFLDALSNDGIALSFDHVGARGERKGPLWVLDFLAALSCFAWLLARRHYGLIHIHVSTDGSALRKWWFGAFARLSRTPYIIHFHGMISEATIAADPPWLRALGSLARGARTVIVLGEAFRPPFRDVLGVADAQIMVIHNGVPDIRADAAIPRSGGDGLNILFCGEIGNRKGMDILVDALATLSTKRWRCIVAGNGSMEPYRAKIEGGGIGARIDMRGWLSLPAVHGLMRQADVVVLPSRAEALPLSLIEGASAGAALVATDIGAVSDIVHDGVNGIVIRHDAGELADALSRLAIDPDLLSAMQSASRGIYERDFTVPVFARRIVSIYRQYGVV